jgi:hypothetical protein
MKSAEYVVFKVYDNERQGSEIARVEASTYKWGPGNAMEKFVAEQRPPAAKYLIMGPGSPTNKLVWCIYTVKYPSFTIEGTRSGGIQLYGEQTSINTDDKE